MSLLDSGISRGGEEEGGGCGREEGGEGGGEREMDASSVMSLCDASSFFNKFQYRLFVKTI